jgi:hypothetical protein
MKLTHVYPKMPGNEQTTIGGNINQVLYDIGQATLDMDDHTSVVAVMGGHENAIRFFHDELEKYEYNPKRLRPVNAVLKKGDGEQDYIEQTVHVGARGPHKSVMQSFDMAAWLNEQRAEKLGKVLSEKDLKALQMFGPSISHRTITHHPAREASTKTVEVKLRTHLGNKKAVRSLARILKQSNVSLLVIFEPDEEGGDLDCLRDLQAECPNLDIVIFHEWCWQYGVEVIGGDDPATMWDTKSQAESEPDLQWVIALLAHVGESTWFGALPKVGKTWVLLCILKSLLTGNPLFSDARLTVPSKAKRCIYLCPEAGMSSMRSRLKKLGLIEHLYDPITNPEGRLYLRTLSKGQKLPLDDRMLLEMAKDAYIFIDTAIRYLEGDENSSKDVKVLTENVLNLLSSGARSLWVAHHAPKGFENASTMSLQNMFRGSGEYGAALSNAYGLCTEDEATTKIRFHCISGRDLDEPIPDMILVGRPHLNNIGNFLVESTNAEPFKGRGSTPGPKDPDRQAKIDFAKSVEGSLQEKADAVNEKFSSEHDKSTIGKWLRGPKFDKDHQ